MASIKGIWHYPSRSRCDKKAAYPSMKIAESKARESTKRASQLIIAYKCFDCSAFHIGHADSSQKLARIKKAKSLPTCDLCGAIISKRIGKFIRTPLGFACGTKNCRRRCAAIRLAARQADPV